MDKKTVKREIRNPKSHRHSEENDRRTALVVEKYYGKCALLATWESEPNDVQLANHGYLLELRKTVRTVKNYLLHRADANIRV